MKTFRREYFSYVALVNDRLMVGYSCTIEERIQELRKQHDSFELVKLIPFKGDRRAVLNFVNTRRT